ncbi:nucleolar protein 14 [Kwoniella heveanensis BCC8398]|uniref:Nucleolar protein 14 n=1 Tax=Kwoniella heveanensis BCC8398 TaxID=1296120 RepID=A0A1B9GWS0_9TREE|nr:nucleolar protein 14 [Kwoniella heveanensis BCC8398]
MAPSQLAQLKSALSSAGLNKKNFSKKEKKAFKKGGAREIDRAKKLDKLEEIRRNLNKFDERETKLKHDVGGRNLKGTVGRPSASKQAGLEARKKSLLPEHQLRDHTGTFRDRRFGEADPTLSMEDRMLERYTRERQKGQGKKGMFNLEDEGDRLTHGGRSVMDLPGDDFDAQGFGERDDDEDEDKGRVDRRAVSRGHFGGFNGEDEDEEELPERKKSKAEVMNEIIAKSKEHKYERQQQKEMDDELRDELDEDLDDLRALLQESAPARPAASNFASTSRQPTTSAAVPAASEEGDYDQVVRSLAFDARAKPKDRTKTEEELALEEKENLEKAEAKRLRRMRGESVSDDEGGEGSRKKRKTDERKPDADDLGDDYIEDDALLGPGLTREDIENMSMPSDEEGEDVDESEEGEEGDDSDEGNEEKADEEEDEEEEDEDEDSDQESAMEDLDDDEAPELVEVDEEEFESVVKKSKGKKAARGGVKKEIPYTFPCPSSIEEFEDLLEGLEDSALPIVVQLWRLAIKRSFKRVAIPFILDFLGVLIDYTLILSARPVPPFDLISSLTPHIIALVKLNAVSAATHFVEKLKLMQKNLTRGLARGPSREDSKTFPRCPELVLLRLIGSIWSTSDFSHPVVAPAVLLMGQYLAQSRIRSVTDLASGLYLSSLLAQYESLSNRLVPEAVNFIASAILTLLPRKKGFEINSTYPDSKAVGADLFVSPTATAVPSQPVNLPAALSLTGEDDVGQTKADLLAVAFSLAQTFTTMYASSDAFVEMMSPVAKVLEGCRVSKLSQELKTLHAAAFTALTRSLRHAKSSRRPLTLQAHKPIPIASYAPKFEENFAPDRHYDPDVERNAAAKLKALYKKERKGAIRELRKDNKFLAGERDREQAEKDRAYNSKMKRVEGDIHTERAEEKAMQREKNREKRRAGRV